MGDPQPALHSACAWQAQHQATTPARTKHTRATPWAGAEGRAGQAWQLRAGGSWPLPPDSAAGRPRATPAWCEAGWAGAAVAATVVECAPSMQMRGKLNPRASAFAFPKHGVQSEAGAIALRARSFEEREDALERRGKPARPRCHDTGCHRPRRSRGRRSRRPPLSRSTAMSSSPHSWHSLWTPPQAQYGAYLLRLNPLVVVLSCRPVAAGS